MTYFRTCGYYHRPWQLNGRVRNGNVCFLPGMLTGKQRVRQLEISPDRTHPPVFRPPRRLRGCVAGQGLRVTPNADFTAEVYKWQRQIVTSSDSQVLGASHVHLAML